MDFGVEFGVESGVDYGRGVQVDRSPVNIEYCGILGIVTPLGPA